MQGISKLKTKLEAQVLVNESLKFDSAVWDLLRFMHNFQHTCRTLGKISLFSLSSPVAAE